MDSVLKFSSSVGLISILWNEFEFVTGVEITPAEAMSTVAKSGEISGKCNGPIPSRILDVVETIRGFIRNGYPVASPDEILGLIELRGLSEFQQQVYRATMQIPHGQTRTYAWIANRVRKPFATRAVGQALRKNPFPMLVPCHRVVAANALGGFMGVSDPELPEMKLKRRLIEIENTYINPFFSFISPGLTLGDQRSYGSCSVA